MKFYLVAWALDHVIFLNADGCRTRRIRARSVPYVRGVRVLITHRKVVDGVVKVSRPDCPRSRDNVCAQA